MFVALEFREIWYEGLSVTIHNPKLFLLGR
jgi:hypothetical protein